MTMSEKTPAPVGAAVALDTPCVESTGPRNGSGYANEWHRFGPGDAESLAHRTAYRLAGGVIPDGMTIDHLCRNKQGLRERLSHGGRDPRRELTASGWRRGSRRQAARADALQARA